MSAGFVCFGIKGAASLIAASIFVAHQNLYTMNTYHTRKGIKQTVLLIVLQACFRLSASAQQQNVLFIIADDLGVDYTEAYQEGTDYPSTPNINSLVQDGILFRNAWSNPVCSPTRATMLTGQYGFRTDIGTVVGTSRRNTDGIDPDTYTLPKALNDANVGYAHASVGKWHLDDESNGGADNPNIMGFDYFSGFVNTTGGSSDFSSIYYNWQKTVNGNTTTATNYMATEQVDDAIGWIGEQEQPWFHWLAFFNPHTPFHKPPNELHSFDDLSGTEEDIQANPVPYFKAAVEAMDTEIGRLISYLKETGQYENTTIVYLGDNGTTSQVVQPPFDADQAKGTLYEGGVNVPFIISGAAVVNPNRESNALVSAVDLFATSLELMNVNVDDVAPSGTTIDAQSLVPIIRNETDVVREWVFTEMFGLNADSDGKAIRNESYKLIRFDSGSEELYNLRQDPFETTDLLSSSLSEEAQTNYQTLTRQLDNLLDSAEEAPNDPGNNPEDDPAPPRRPRRPFARTSESVSTVYPNPSSDAVTVTLTGDTSSNYAYTISDNAGRAQVRGRGQGGSLFLDISNLEPGTYYLKVRLPDGISTTRIVKE